MGIGVALALLMPPPAHAQPAPADSALGAPLEAWFEPLAEDDEDGGPSDLLERLEALREHPLDLNAASAADLALLPFLSPRLAGAIVRHRERAGPFASVEGVLAVESVTPITLAEIRPFVTVAEEMARSRRTVPRPRIDLLQRVQRRLDLGTGYTPLPDSIRESPEAPTRYLGSPERVYTRFRGSVGRTLSANLTLEKDPGEAISWSPSEGAYGYDFASAHVALRQVGPVEAFVVGDYVVELGQGVALWRAAGFGKGREAVRPLVRRGRGVRPYGSTNENQHFRGAAATVSPIPALAVTGFASRHRVDARLSAPDSLDGIAVLSRPTTGLHRTPSELGTRRTLGQGVIGGGAELRLPRGALGAVVHRTAWEHPLMAGAQPYQRFGPAGEAVSVASLYGHASLEGTYLFGEVAHTGGGAMGGVGGVEAGLGTLDVLALVRHYPRDFVSPHGYAFGERNGATQNESGVYLGAQIRPGPRWTLSGYIDQYRFPWARFGVALPSRGYEALAYAEHRPRRWLAISLQARAEAREGGTRVTTETGGTLDGLAEEARHSLRLQGEFVAGPTLRLRARVEGTRYRHGEVPAEQGVVLYQDLRWTPRRSLTLDARLTFFDTDGFGARLYQYEQDLTGVFANTLLSGQGSRAYAVLTLRPTSRVDLQLKMASTRYEDRHLVGSGLDAVEGNHVRDVGVQARIRF